MRLSRSALLLLTFWSPLLVAQESHLSIRPTLRLEKPRYVLGESIRFWLGVAPKDSDSFPAAVIEARKPCSLTISKPDGTSEVQPVGWPVDGDPRRGWTGGWGFHAASIGEYSLVLECSGERSETMSLIVEQNPVVRQITTAFHFEKSGSISANTSVPVLFTVKNNSPYSISFPKRGAMAEGISLLVYRHQPPASWGLFYPWEKLASSSLLPDTYSWNVAARIPSITLRPGEQFEQPLLLEDGFKFDMPGEYEVVFSTVVSVLVGEADGQFKDLCPIRMLAEEKQNFKVEAAKP